MDPLHVGKASPEGREEVTTGGRCEKEDVDAGEEGGVYGLRERERGRAGGKKGRREGRKEKEGWKGGREGVPRSPLEPCLAPPPWPQPANCSVPPCEERRGDRARRCGILKEGGREGGKEGGIGRI